MNRILARPVTQLSRRPLISSGQTGGHSWYRQGYAVFSSHSAGMRYLGLGLMITTPLPFAFLFWDDLYDDDKYQAPIEAALFPEFLSFLCLTDIAFAIAFVGHFAGRVLAFGSFNMF